MLTKLIIPLVSTSKKRSSPSRSVSPVKIGCILSVAKKKYSDPYFMAILSGIENRLHTKGYEISFIRTGPELEEKETLVSTFQEQTTGLIFMDEKVLI